MFTKTDFTQLGLPTLITEDRLLLLLGTIDGDKYLALELDSESGTPIDALVVQMGQPADNHPLDIEEMDLGSAKLFTGTSANLDWALYLTCSLLKMERRTPGDRDDLRDDVEYVIRLLIDLGALSYEGILQELQDDIKKNQFWCPESFPDRLAHVRCMNGEDRENEIIELATEHLTLLLPGWMATS